MSFDTAQSSFLGLDMRYRVSDCALPARSVTSAIVKVLEFPTAELCGSQLHLVAVSPLFLTPQKQKPPRTLDGGRWLIISKLLE